ncbi:hypothetical protein SDC9_159854 [bioreactor metagenome]|uniref:Uncharacterized protein n=1 Tax=bioreactor metagenome TaxID=1076179 RepID=A0A645FFZ9_9ZZZZ
MAPASDSPKARLPSSDRYDSGARQPSTPSWPRQPGPPACWQRRTPGTRLHANCWPCGFRLSALLRPARRRRTMPMPLQSLQASPSAVCARAMRPGLKPSWQPPNRPACRLRWPQQRPRGPRRRPSSAHAFPTSALWPAFQSTQARCPHSRTDRRLSCAHAT